MLVGTPLASLLLQTGEMFEQRILWELNQWGRLAGAPEMLMYWIYPSCLVRLTESIEALIKLQMQQRGPVPDGLVQWRWVPAMPPDPPPQTKAAPAHGYGAGAAPMPQSLRKDGSERSGGMDETAKVVQGLRSRLDSAGDEHEVQRRLRQMFREWHPDKRSEAEQQLATRVFQWLQDEKAWAVFDKWSAEGRADAMQQLAPAVLARPYCEPGKLAWLATTCILLLRGADAEQALECAASLDEDLLGQMTVLSYETKHNTRFHLVLRSPWPAFRMLDLLARLMPEKGSTRLGACRKNTKWNSDPDVFDWPQFKKLLSEAVDELVSDESMFDLRPSDGPLSQQYSARWQRIHSLPAMKEVVYFSHDVFDAYRQHHYKAGCHLGVISCYILQIFVVLLRDIEGRLHKQVASVAQLVNIYGPVQQTAKTDWPVFRLLHFASLLQRAHPHDIWMGNQANEQHAAARDAAKSLVTEVEAATETKFASGGEAAPIAFLTSAWGWMSKILDAVLKRWRVVSKTSPLLVLCRDDLALRNCKTSQKFNDPRPMVQCIDAPQRLGVETMVAKYIAMASIVRSGMHAVWLDLDVFIVADPSPFVMSELARQPSSSLLFSRHLLSESVTPAVVIARPNAEAVSLLMGFAGWLRENPYLLDHKAWDQFLTNNKGDFAGVFDYKGRNTTGHETEGPTHTFLPRFGLAPVSSNWSFIKSGFASGDGWRGREEDVVLFHFWGAEESPEELFRIFYNKKALLSPALDSNAAEILQKYRREPVSAPLVSVLLKKEPLYLVAISYAHGCCRKSLQRNREHALKAGVDAARSYGKQHLGPDWLAANDAVLSQKRGAGWWLWKPYVILKTLKDPVIPWDKGVVLWVDAGNYLHADPRPFLASALEESDVVALRLKQCLEVDWTSKLTLEQMNMSSRYALIDRPQLGAYFLAFRKTKAVLSFVEQWLKLSEDPDTLMGLAVRNLNSHGGTGTLTSDILDDEVPSFMTHQADQSIFSLLFKRYGYRASSLEAAPRQGGHIGSLARVEAKIKCRSSFADAAEHAADTAVKQGASPQQVGWSVAAKGAIGAAAAARAVSQSSARKEVARQVAMKAFRAAQAAGVSTYMAAKAAAKEASKAVAFAAALQGEMPANVGASAKRVTSWLADLAETEQVKYALDAAQEAVEQVLLLAEESEEAIIEAKRAAANGVVDASAAVGLERIADWINPGAHIDFFKGGLRAAEALAQLASFRFRQSEGYAAFARAAEARTATARAAAESALPASLPGGHPPAPADTVRAARQAAIAHGVHQAAAANLAAVFAARAVTYQDILNKKTPAATGADVKAVAETAGVGPQTKLKLEEDLAAFVAQRAADAGLPPAKVGAEVWKALEAINGQKYSFDTVKSDVEKHSLPPYQGFMVIPGPGNVPLQEQDEVCDFTIYQVDKPDEKKIFPSLRATELLRKLNTPHKAGTRPSGETYEEWAEWEKTSRTSIQFTAFDISARDVPGSSFFTR
eukprot:s1589_g6.t1